ncbi:MAG: tRNA uridine-5-carboxymethylaminomethyl(34) synthesis GTPase MnmE [Pseudomonadota bacterium]
MDTIFALSSGALPSGVAIIRLSGPHARQTLERLTDKQFEPRKARLSSLVDDRGQVLDEALCLYFRAPHSFTGEEVVELHCHGGRATVDALLSYLGSLLHHRMAEAGEFSRRAFLNNRMDLTAMEGLSDLIAAQTESQRRLALSQTGGALRAQYDAWRDVLIKSRAMIEAEFDFSDEDDIPDEVSATIWAGVEGLKREIYAHLNEGKRGEIIRDGFKVVLMGPPNAGKSSLLNALAKREVAIVTEIPGTTRDVLEVSLDMEGQLVIVSDTAGIRDTDDVVELEGIKRAHAKADEADLVFYLMPPGEEGAANVPVGAIVVLSKSDLSSVGEETNKVSVVEADGLDFVFGVIKRAVSNLARSEDTATMSRHRHRQELTVCRAALEESLEAGLPLELRSEALRQAGDALGRLTGRIDVEHLLDVIFSEFCVGK